jgi:glycosyltransferase involved in cell wall biosynthesis
MVKKTTISVLMAVYNTEFVYIKRAIDSVLKQDFQDFELIIIDDGSKENNRDMLLQYVEQHEDKLIYIRHHNQGQSASINRGVKNSNGQYITILDSDDEYKPHHLRACLAEIENLDLICSTTETIVNSDADYYVPDKDDHTQLIHLDETVLFGTLFGRKNVFHALQFKSGFAADADFFEKASALFRVKKVNLRTYIYHRTMPNSICATLIKANLSNAL